jgi:hypothetical protein
MLQRSLSDLRLGDKAMGFTGSEDILTPGKKHQKPKKEILASLRRSFRKKNRSPVLKNCDDDFTSFSSHSTVSTPQIARVHKTPSSHSMPTDTNGSNSLSSTSAMSNGMSDSDSVSQTPPPMRRNGNRVCKNSDGEDAAIMDTKASPDQEDLKIVGGKGEGEGREEEGEGGGREREGGGKEGGGGEGGKHLLTNTTTMVLALVGVVVSCPSPSAIIVEHAECRVDIQSTCSAHQMGGVRRCLEPMGS